MSELKTMVHVTSFQVGYRGRRRTVCAWCGLILDDKDLSRIAVQLNEDGTTPELGHWPVDVLVEVSGNVGFRMMSVIDDPGPDGDQAAKDIYNDALTRSCMAATFLIDALESEAE